jgi:hypothetical protein
MNLVPFKVRPLRTGIAPWNAAYLIAEAAQRDPIGPTSVVGPYTAETIQLRRCLSALDPIISDESSVVLWNLYHFFLESDSYDREMLRASPILDFIDKYFHFLSEMPYPLTQEIVFQLSVILARMLQHEVYSPSDICDNIEFMQMLIPYLQSAIPAIESGITLFFSALVAENDFPPIAERAFFRLAVNCRSSFQKIPAKCHCLRFIQRIFCHIVEIPDVRRAQMNRCLYEVLTDPHLSKIYIEAIDALRLQLFYHPDHWLPCQKLLSLAMQLLVTTDDELLIGLYQLLSVLLNSDCPIEDWLYRIPFGAIVMNLDAINLKLAKATISLILDFAARGEGFIEGLIQHELFDVLSQNYDRPWPIKRECYELTRNILLIGSAAQCMQSFDSEFFVRQSSELEVLPAPRRAAFLRSIQIATQKAKAAGWFDDLSGLFTRARLFVSLLEIRDGDDPEMAELAEALLLEFGDFNQNE